MLTWFNTSRFYTDGNPNSCLMMNYDYNYDKTTIYWCVNAQCFSSENRSLFSKNMVIVLRITGNGRTIFRFSIIKYGAKNWQLGFHVTISIYTHDAVTLFERITCIINEILSVTSGKVLMIKIQMVRNNRPY